MLAGLLAPYIQGRYSLIHVPISLPLTVLDLVPSLQIPTLQRTSTPELPPAAPGCAWAVLQAGQQIATGVPGGRNTFYVRSSLSPISRSQSHRKPSSNSPSCKSGRNQRRR